MKFRNPETGEVENDINAVGEKYCNTEQITTLCKDCELGILANSRGFNSCVNFQNSHPLEAAALMCYEVIPELGDDTAHLDTVAEVFNKTGKEDNMGKPRICEVLGVEVDERFSVKDRRGEAWLYVDKNGWVKYEEDESLSASALQLAINHPEFIIRKPRFTQQDIDDAKMIRMVFNKDGIVKRQNKAMVDPYSTLVFNNIYINENMLPSIKEGQEYSLDEIINGVKVI